MGWPDRLVETSHAFLSVRIAGMGGDGGMLVTLFLK